MTPQATHAIEAAKHEHRWGPYAAARYCANNKVPARLFILARRLEKEQANE